MRFVELTTSGLPRILAGLGLISLGRISRSSPSKNRLFKKNAYFGCCDYRHCGLFLAGIQRLPLRGSVFAGAIHPERLKFPSLWIPACAGMTVCQVSQDSANTLQYPAFAGGLSRGVHHSGVESLTGLSANPLPSIVTQLTQSVQCIKRLTWCEFIRVGFFQGVQGRVSGFRNFFIE